jgi:hypothetical protein
MDTLDLLLRNRDLLSFIIALLGITSFSFFIMPLIFRVLTKPDKEKEDIKKKLRLNIAEKIKANLKLSVADIINIGRGIGTSRSDSIEVIYELLAEAKEEKDITTVKSLIDEINKKEPFDDLPEEVKPSMIRLAELCSNAQTDSDRSLLIPIRRTLADYRIMQADHQKIKTQSKISYIITIISVCIGVIGLVFAFRAPNREYIKDAIESSIKSEVQKLESKKGSEPTSTSRDASQSIQP